jgi:ABC-type phosphate transport system permease subunit
MLGLGRALGETMAVTFVIGNAHGFPTSLFAPARPSPRPSPTSSPRPPASCTSRPDLAGPGALRHHLRVLALARLLIGRQQTYDHAARPAPRRRLGEGVFLVVCWVGHGIALIALAAILWSLLSKGVGGLDLDGLHHVDAGAGLRGGLLNAILGSLMMCALAMVGAVCRATWPAPGSPSTPARAATAR